MRKPLNKAKTRSGLTLLEAVLGVLLCVLIVAVSTFGFVTVVTAIYASAVILGLTILWGLAYLRAPNLTMNGSVLLITGLVMFSWVPGRLLQMREAARRHGTVNNLRELGQAIRGLEDTGRPGGFEQHFQEYLELEEVEAAMSRALREETEND